MKRRPLRPSREPIARYTELPRPTKPMRAKRAGKPRRRAGACRPYLDWLMTQACRITWCHTGEVWLSGWDNNADVIPYVVDPAHVRTKRLGGDLWNAISLAHHLHEELHQHGIKTFATKYGVNLTDLAIAQTEQWLATPEGQEWLADHPEVAA